MRIELWREKAPLEGDLEKPQEEVLILTRLIVGLSVVEMDGRKQDMKCWVLHQEHFMVHMEEQRMSAKIGESQFQETWFSC